MPDLPRPPLQRLLADAAHGVLLFAVTPPRSSASPERVKEIAAVTLDRLAPLDLDGLVLYDIDDESDRNPGERPFPYLPTVDPARYHAEHLHGWDRPTVIYRCVSKYAEADLRDWLGAADPRRVLGVFVGPSSSDKPVRTDLRRAQELRAEVCPDLHLGGVVIGERHTRRGDEHLRMLAKQERGCSFFVSQVVYDVDETKDLVSDYFYACRDRGVAPRTVIFTLSLCGSPRTLEFLGWLGVDVPRWLRNSINHAADPLSESYRQTLAIARDLADFCRHLGMPHGFNVESVSIRRAEIEATTDLAADVAALLDRP
ncbi:5,10-methylenetetrahydrofolate reductase [Asanoa sp. WMMD1127]|uniref:methylenetetrahydrofolate reductase n=1 Tax=Asanoa sp. WMMD1127 TaxID=3016107 RepID=UPI002417C3AF|nr:5,10-methylenetetrahydrofolate reductase [Asanoa sp. WMMD1127]MDG4824492.1 5,10-methylenetetrahydrofolate reductase [Asanoa sp. WMMD1127]